MTNATENHAVRLHVDRGVLRDIIEARIVQDKRRSYYTIGSVFSGMGFTLVAMGSTNYTAATLFVLLGVFYYLCIVGANVNYVAEEEEDAEAKCDEEMDDEIQAEETEETEEADAEEEEGIEFTNLSALTRHEKMLLFRTLFEDLSGFDIEAAELRQLLRPETRAPAPSVAEESVYSEPSSDADASTETIVQDGATGPRLARAETSYSQPEVVPVAEVTPPVEVAQPTATEPINLDTEDEIPRNNSAEEDSGAATPETSSDAN